MDEENNSYLKVFNDLDDAINKINSIDISLDELSSITDYNLKLKILDMLDQINSLNVDMKN